MIAPELEDLAGADIGPDWRLYKACRICGAAAGGPCVSRFETIVDGRPTGSPRTLPVAHGHRKRRADGNIVR